VADLERAQDGKAESFFYTYTAAGSALQAACKPRWKNRSPSCRFRK
jgi:hypothetical protein